MKEIGIESSLLQSILAGHKTLEGRLGKPSYLKIRPGDTLSVREDTWQGHKLVSSRKDAAKIRVKQILYFESFAEMLETLGHRNAVPLSNSVEEAVKTYRQFYTVEAEEEFGVVALLFETV